MSKKAALTAAPPQVDWIKSIGLVRGGGLLRTRVWQGLNVDATSGVTWRMNDGRALWVESSLGAGRIALLTTSVDRDDSDLAIRPGFVPLLRGRCVDCQATKHRSSVTASCPDKYGRMLKRLKIACFGALMVEFKGAVAR